MMNFAPIISVYLDMTSQYTEPSVPFVYPNEEISSSSSNVVVDDEKILPLLNFLYCYVLTSKNVQTTLAALCYASGFDVGDLYGCPNTARSISKAMGICHIQMHKELLEISSSLGLVPRINSANK